MARSLDIYSNMTGTMLLPCNQAVHKQYLDMTSKEKLGEVAALFRNFDPTNKGQISQEEGLTVLRAAGMDRTKEVMAPFFKHFCCHNLTVSLDELTDVMKERLHEERRSKSFEYAMKKLDEFKTGTIRASDAKNVLRIITDDRLVHLISYKEELILEKSRFEYQEADLCAIVRRF
jgi:Ca2+-binding EF-hand superfamily protein